MEKRYAILRGNEVVNVTIWDGVSEWQPDEGCTAIECPDDAGPGWTYENGEWAAPEEKIDG